MTQKSGVFIIIVIIIIIIIIPVKMLLDIFDAFISYLKCTKIMSILWQLPLSYHGELVLIISYFFRHLLWLMRFISGNFKCIRFQCAILVKQFGPCNLPRLYDIWISPTLRNY